MKKTLLISVFFAIFANICIAQGFLKDDLHYWDFPLNALGNFDNGVYAWVASDSFETDWYTTYFNDQNWSTPVEGNFTNYPPLVWTADPLNNPPNSEIYLRGHIRQWITSGSIEKVKIMIMANDDYQMYLNGNLIGEDLDGTAGPVGVYDVTNVWNGGVNKIAIKGINTFWSGWVQCLVRIYFGYTTTVINDNSNSNTLQLSQNYPNPFNPSTTIRYSLTSPEKVSIKIYDVSGQLVKEINIEHSQSGEYEVVWDGTNNFNQKVSSGAYFYQISAGEYIEAKKMILLK